MPTTYRAAYWLAADRQADVRLTTEAHPGLPDAELLAVAQQCIDDTGLEREDGDEIVIGDYRG